MERIQIIGRRPTIDPVSLDSEAVELSHDDRLFIALLLEYGRVAPAAMEAYHQPDPVKAGRIGNAALKRMPDVLNMILDHHGLTDAHLATTIMAGMEANRTKFATHQGKITDSKVTADHQARATFTRLGMDLRGHHARNALTLEDSEGRPLGPVILPVRAGLELPAVYNVGGDTKGPPEALPIPGDAEGSPVVEDAAPEENTSGEGKDFEGWDDEQK